MQQVQVVLPLPLTEPFDYVIPEGLHINPGNVVSVPFGTRQKYGVVWGEATGNISQDKLKAIDSIIDVPLLSQAFMDFVDWVADYTVSPKGAVLAMVMSIADAFDPPKMKIGYQLGQLDNIKMTDKRERVFALVKQGAIFARQDLAREAGVSVSVINQLIEQGALMSVAMKEEKKLDSVLHNHPTLSTEQKAAAHILQEKIEAHTYSATLLDGVTGSGKTEVYSEAIEAALNSGKQILVLLPEIVLTAQLLDRFKKRFGFMPTQWHSGLTKAKRRTNYRDVMFGKAKLIVGARSALFLPYSDLGLIVIDEEHESAYKQEEGVVYHARDMAIARGFIEKIPVILVSATPSVETILNVSHGKYDHVHLPQRYGIARIPTIQLVDMRKYKPDAHHWLSTPLREAIEDTLNRNEQALLYLNRRGYAPLTLCRKCGYRFKSPDSSAWMVMHHPPGREAYLQCHHSGFTMPIPTSCPQCKAEDSFVVCGPGVERLQEEVKHAFPNARIAIMTSDTMMKIDKARETIQDILDHKIDIIIGTQMVTKGHHFPHLTLVGIVDADLGLEGGDLRAGEKTFQILHQVAGRAGREEQMGKAYIQTYVPDHKVMQALVANDRDKFVAEEMAMRQVTSMPPYGRLAAIIIAGKEERKVHEAARMLAKYAPSGPKIEVLGPAPAPLSLLRGKYRYRLLVKTERNINIQKLIRVWLGHVKLPSTIKVKIDIDPYSFM